MTAPVGADARSESCGGAGHGNRGEGDGVLSSSSWRHLFRVWTLPVLLSVAWLGRVAWGYTSGALPVRQTGWETWVWAALAGLGYSLRSASIVVVVPLWITAAMLTWRHRKSRLLFAFIFLVVATSLGSFVGPWAALRGMQRLPGASRLELPETQVMTTTALVHAVGSGRAPGSGRQLDEEVRRGFAWPLSRRMGVILAVGLLSSSLGIAIVVKRVGVSWCISICSAIAVFFAIHASFRVFAGFRSTFAPVLWVSLPPVLVAGGFVWAMKRWATESRDREAGEARRPDGDGRPRERAEVG